VKAVKAESGERPRHLANDGSAAASAATGDGMASISMAMAGVCMA